MGRDRPTARAVYVDGIGLGDTFPEFGSKTLGIDTLSGGIVTRAVLLDMVDLLDGPDAAFLADGHDFGRAEVERALARRSLALHPGDAVIFYTGFQARLAADPDAWVFQGPKYNPVAPGLRADSLPLWGDAKTLRWFPTIRRSNPCRWARGRCTPAR